MKIDPDYLKKILLTFEASPTPIADILFLRENGLNYEDDAFVFHMGILVDLGLVERDDGDRGFGMFRGADGHIAWSRLPLRMRARGYEFLEDIRDPEIWQITKERSKKVGQASLEFLWEIAKAEIKSKLGLVA